jgi:hypothetical protein
LPDATNARAQVRTAIAPPLRSVKGELLAQHFAVNSGATYKYNVESMSLTFEQSPPSVLLALDA